MCSSERIDTTRPGVEYRSSEVAGTTVTIVQETLPEYRKAFFQSLREALLRSGVELKIVHGEPSSIASQKSDQESLPWARSVRNLRIRRATWTPALRECLSSDLVICEQANRHLLNYVLLILNRVMRRPRRFALWGHGRNLQDKEASLRNAFKKIWSRQADWWFAYTPGSARRLIDTGYPRHRTTVVWNTVDTSYFAASQTDHKKPFRCVYVGGLYREKRISFLIDAATIIGREIPAFQLVIIGDGPDRPIVEGVKTEHIVYAGRLTGESKAQQLSEASLMLMPGLVGLAIIDSFAAETPIVATDIWWHSPEIEYLVPDENGVLVTGSPSADQYARAVIDTLHDTDRIARLKAGCKRSSQALTMEKMVANFAGGVLLALTCPRKGVNDGR